MRDGDPDADVGPDTDEVWHRRKVYSIIVLCLVVLGVLGIGVTAVFVLEQRAYIDCQRGYNDEVIQTLRDRSNAGSLDRQALRATTSSTVALVDIILTSGATQEQKLAAVQSWRDAQSRANEQLVEADDARAKNPLPGPRQC